MTDTKELFMSLKNKKPGPLTPMKISMTVSYFFHQKIKKDFWVRNYNPEHLYRAWLLLLLQQKIELLKED